MTKGEFAQNQRKERMKIIVQSMAALYPEGIEIEDYCAMRAYEWGLTLKKIKEYITQLKLAGIIKIDGDKMYHAG